MIVKAERLVQGPNCRFVVTNLDDELRALYTARGDMENRIKEQPLGLFADRTSCRRFFTNHFRLLRSMTATNNSRGTGSMPEQCIRGSG